MDGIVFIKPFIQTKKFMVHGKWIYALDRGKYGHILRMYLTLKILCISTAGRYKLNTWRRFLRSPLLESKIA